MAKFRARTEGKSEPAIAGCGCCGGGGGGGDTTTAGAACTAAATCKMQDCNCYRFLKKSEGSSVGLSNFDELSRRRRSRPTCGGGGGGGGATMGSTTGWKCAPAGSWPSWLDGWGSGAGAAAAAPAGGGGGAGGCRITAAAGKGTWTMSFPGDMTLHPDCTIARIFDHYEYVDS